MTEWEILLLVVFSPQRQVLLNGTKENWAHCCVTESIGLIGIVEKSRDTSKSSKKTMRPEY
jgi:hypothetical protein